MPLPSKELRVKCREPREGCKDFVIFTFKAFTDNDAVLPLT